MNKTKCFITTAAFAALGGALAKLFVSHLKDSKLKKEAVTFSHLAMSLAGDYSSVYYLSLEDNSYTEYCFDEGGDKLRVICTGDDFFADTHTNCAALVYKDDQQRFLNALQKDTLLEIVRNGGTFTLDYRLVIDGKPLYYNLKTCRAIGRNTKHIVIGVRNVDEQTRRRLAYEKALDNAIDLAERDGLTGVKNKAAYEQAEAKLDREISALSEISSGKPEFALVICDVNSLKSINDSFGHKAGDEFLKAACNMICRVYKHSPVFRIGGDEFAVLLQGEDFKNRDSLIKALKEQVKANIGTSSPTVACGMAVFIPDKDKTASAVFNRADAAMYRNKKQFSHPPRTDSQ